MIKLASSYDTLLNLDDEIKQASSKPDQFHTADAYYDAASDKLPKLDKNPSKVEISNVEQTLAKLDKITQESKQESKQADDNTEQADDNTESNTSDDQQVDATSASQAVSTDPSTMMNADIVTDYRSFLNGSVKRQTNTVDTQTDEAAESNNANIRVGTNDESSDPRDRIRNFINQQAYHQTTPVNRDEQTIGSGLDQQKVTPITADKIDRDAGKKSLTAGTKALNMIDTGKIDQFVNETEDQINQEIDQTQKKLEPAVVIDGQKIDDLPASVDGQYQVSANDQTVILTKQDTAAADKQISELNRQLADTQTKLADVQSKLKTTQQQLKTTQQQLKAVKTDHGSNTEAVRSADRAVSNTHDQQPEAKQHADLTPADKISSALVKIRDRLFSDNKQLMQVDQIDDPTAEFKTVVFGDIANDQEQSQLVQQLLRRRDSQFSQQLQHADRIAVQVTTSQQQINPRIGSLSLLDLTQARSLINVQFFQKDRKS